MSALSTLRIQREFGYLPGIFQASRSLPLGYGEFSGHSWARGTNFRDRSPYPDVIGRSASATCVAKALGTL